LHRESVRRKIALIPEAEDGPRTREAEHLPTRNLATSTLLDYGVTIDRHLLPPSVVSNSPSWSIVPS